jgi:hypothetical protein
MGMSKLSQLFPFLLYYKLKIKNRDVDNVPESGSLNYQNFLSPGIFTHLGGGGVNKIE